MQKPSAKRPGFRTDETRRECRGKRRGCIVARQIPIRAEGLRQDRIPCLPREAPELRLSAWHGSEDLRCIRDTLESIQAQSLYTSEGADRRVRAGKMYPDHASMLPRLAAPYPDRPPNPVCSCQWNNRKMPLLWRADYRK